MGDIKDMPDEPPVKNDATDWFMRKFAAPEGVVKSRLAICAKCEHYNTTTRLCGKCHCVMPFKARMAGAKCPEGKWHRFVRPPKLGEKL